MYWSDHSHRDNRTSPKNYSNAGKSRFPMGSSRSEFGGGKGVSQGVGSGEMQELLPNDNGGENTEILIYIEVQI